MTTLTHWQAVLAAVLLATGAAACKPRPPKPVNKPPERDRRTPSALVAAADSNPTPIYKDSTLEKLGLDPRWYRMITKRELAWIERDLKDYFDIELPSASGSFVTQLEVGQTGGLPGIPKNTLVTFFMPPDDLESFKEHVRERTQANTGFERRWGAYSEGTWNGEPERTCGFDFPVGTLTLRCAGSIRSTGERGDDAVEWTFPPHNEWVRYRYHDYDDSD